MKRALEILIFFSIFSLAFLPGDVLGSSPCSNSLLPPFIANGVKPNILIILDNSNSMDEDFYGNAVGSYSPDSKSVIARQALQSLITGLKDKADIGIMTFTLPGNVGQYYIHNAMPFASYDPHSYCPNAPQACVQYCIDPSNTTAKNNCDAACGTGFTDYIYPTTGTPFPDSIITNYPANSSTRARYCELIYPKTQEMVNPADTSNYIYWKQPDPFYASGNEGTQFGYCSSYNPGEGVTNSYAYYYSKTGQSDAYQGYSSYHATYNFYPTDSDYALGFYNWGRRLPLYYVGPTWFSSSSPGSPQGYLKVAVGDLTDQTQFDNVYNVLDPEVDTSQNVTDSTPYMSCTASDKNTCSYIINAGNTPTAGALQSALNYFNGTYKQNGVTLSSPISAVCQKNYIILVTDGLPDTKLDGSMPFDSTVMSQVITELSDLQTQVTHVFTGNGGGNGNKQTTYTFPVKTYVLGLDLTAQAKTNLDDMAVAGGTASSSGHAYYADSAGQLTSALQSIIANLLAHVAAGSSISILSNQTQNGANMLQGVFYPQKYFGSKTIAWPGYLYDWWFYNGPTYNNIREDTVHDYTLGLKDDYGLSFLFDSQNGLSVSRYKDPTGSGNPTVFVDNVGLDSLTPIWEAGKMLWEMSADSRKIYTPGNNGNGSGLVSFDALSDPSLVMPGTSALGDPSTFDSCLQGSSGSATLQNLVSYVRGNDITTHYCSNGTDFNNVQCTSNNDCTSSPYTICAPLSCRSRTVGLCSNGTDFNNTTCSSSSDCTTAPYNTCVKNTWKLGDIVYSTPKVETDYKYCATADGSSFNNQFCTQDSDCTTAPYTSCRKKESVVFVGANDGMLHAFETGVLSDQGLDTSQGQVEKLTGVSTSDMGKELWSFIPKNVLPYLRCLAVPPPNSCHLYYNDLSPYITTMVSNGVTKRILIGGMRLGGGSVDAVPDKYCFNSAGVSDGATCNSASNCPSAYNSSCSSAYPTNAPADTCSGGYVACSDPTTCYNPSNCTGLSSYYALDITDVEHPKLLWEFSHPLMGYSYSGPAVIHKWSNTTTMTGDQYYVMFLSGPTDPALGTSIQDVHAFILKLDANLKISSVYYKDFGNTTQNGFGGRLFTKGLDVDGDGYTDYVFFGYGYSSNGQADDWHGGIGKIYTDATMTDPITGNIEIDPVAGLDPSKWTYDVSTYSNIAQLPITAQVATMKCFNTWYLYTGTGRYFFALDDYGSNGNSGLNYIMGVPFTCDQYNENCQPTINSLNQNNDACSALQDDKLSNAAWQYDLDPGSGSYLSERMVTDPTTAPGNKIYFTTSEPTSDPCGYGGQSRVWGLNCATGAAITDSSCTGYTVTDLSGTLYLQTSTGAVYDINAASSFTNNSNGNRTTQWFIGMPPENSVPVISPPAPSNPTPGQLIQWIEK